MTLFVSLSDIITAACVLLAMLAAAWALTSAWLRQRRCKHDGGVNETQACDAICRQCGKNLGFIGTWRLAQPGNRRAGDA